MCQNGATCTNSIGGFSCICVNGWTGPDCSVNIDDCAGAACFNGATCIDRVGSFYCRCTPGKTGKLMIKLLCVSVLICLQGRHPGKLRLQHNWYIILAHFLRN